MHPKDHQLLGVKRYADETYSFLPPNGIFFIDVSNLTCCILMTREISTLKHLNLNNILLFNFARIDVTTFLVGGHRDLHLL